MIGKTANTLLIAFVLFLGWSTAWAAQAPKPPYPTDATFTTLVTTPLVIEGLTGDGTYLYAAARQTSLGAKCPIYRVNISTRVLETIGYIPASNTSTAAGQPLPCNPAGVAFDSLGRLFIAESQPVLTEASQKVYILDPPFAAETIPGSAPTAPYYASGVPGANGIAFKGSDLWISDGTSNQGRVWKVGPNGGDCASSFNCEEVFRIQPMNNSFNVGRTNTTNPGTAQNLVANGLAFNAEGNLLVADTARGALWLVKFDKNGDLESKRDCDHTFNSNTLCLENLFRADPRLEGADGIALDNSGNIWAAVNERNAIVFSVFYGTSNSAEVFRNPINSSGLRNSGNNIHILEFPTSPFLSGTKLCVTSSDGDRRDNSPASGGEISPSGSLKGKISCMDQPLSSPGLPLPR
jgi:hypothetical protein